MEMISVIVPVYNVADYIEKCIESLLLQTYSNIEIILIDDGSNDGSAEICDKYAKEDERILVIHKENNGVSYARNLGLEVAKGDYIGFIDADDWVDNNMYEHMLLCMKEKDVQICITPHYYINYEQDKNINYFEENIIDSITAIRYLLNWEFPNSLWLGLYRKNVINGIFLNVDIHYWEDFEYQFRVLCNSSSIVICRDRFYHLRTRVGSATRSLVNIKNCSSLFIADSIENYVSNNIPELNRYAKTLKVKFLMNLIVDFCRKGADDEQKIAYIINNESKKCLNYAIKSQMISYKSKVCIMLNAVNPNIFRYVYKLFCFLDKKKTYYNKL